MKRNWSIGVMVSAVLVLTVALGCQRPGYDAKDQVGKRVCGGDLGNGSLSSNGTSSDSSFSGNAASSDSSFSGNGASSDGSLARVAGSRALLASRFETMEELQSVVDIDYFGAGGGLVADGEKATAVRVVHCSHGLQVTSILAKGLSQDDISKAQQGGLLDAAGLAWEAPFAVANREDLRRVLTLARRKPAVFGEGDLAFFDLAEATVKHINTPDLAFLSPRDTSEKGYLNTFNHVTAQAFIATIFSEEVADFVADVHERKNMPELVTGVFTEEQMGNPDNNPIDNYVDIINNEWGQVLGMELREKYNIRRETVWTPVLLADYLNDLQAYYAWAFQIGLEPFRAEDELVVRFAEKINLVMGGLTISNG